MTLGLLLVLAGFGVWVYALIDVTKERDVETRTLSQAAWSPIVFLGFAPAALAWLAFGRSRPGDRVSLVREDVVPETSEEFRERVRARAEEQRRRYAEQRRQRPD